MRNGLETKFIFPEGNIIPKEKIPSHFRHLENAEIAWLDVMSVKLPVLEESPLDSVYFNRFRKRKTIEIWKEVVRRGKSLSRSSFHCPFCYDSGWGKMEIFFKLSSFKSHVKRRHFLKNFVVFHKPLQRQNIIWSEEDWHQARRLEL